MAELVLSTIGQAVGARLPGALGSIGAALGRAGGAMLGRSLDQQLFGAAARYEGVRLTDLHVQASTEGASIPAVFGSVRIAGQVIWAARFKEHADTRSEGGGKGGPRATSRTYRYSLSFAVGLCEGEISRLGRVWANGEPFDLSAVAYRVHTGAEDQAVDPLIEAIEGPEHAPAYRGLAYVVFEELALEAFGNAIPQLSFEVIRPAPNISGAVRFEERVKSVCLIPGAGEFVYANTPIFRRLGPGVEIAENLHAERSRANFLVSLDQLKADFPNLETVQLVVAWFGDDLRCGECTIRPGVEVAAKDTSPLIWRSGGVDRVGARLVSQFEGASAYGGTPSDASVLQAIAALRARGYRVVLYPFVLMDVPQANGLPDPYGGADQAAYPWRGRVTLHPAAGQSGSPDKTSAAGVQVSAFFGSAQASHFGVGAGVPTYFGPNEWSYRRFILHYARLALLAGGVDGFVIGSELRGVTTARSAPSTYPAITALKALAADVRSMLGANTKLTYAADWSEYGGHQPQDGSGDVYFHLDPLWADANIDAIGIDWYPPLTDWRAGVAHLDASLVSNIHDLEYLKGRIEAGEAYDWYYADDAARLAQSRAAISDGAANEPWIYRAKDVRNFWSRAHYDRPGGVRSAAPTAWVPESKPIWFVELGCPAVDKGANAPNLFSDGKSAESALPLFSSGARDDLIQRRTLEAYLDYWAGDANPASTIDGKPMIETLSLWAWDVRPYPAFPARGDVWADGPSWRLGHWLNGRAGLSGLGDVVRALCARAGAGPVDVSGLVGAISGYVIDSPSSARAVLEPLMAAYDFTAGERGGVLHFFHPVQRTPIEVGVGELAEASSSSAFAQRADPAEAPIEARVRFIDAARDYLIAAASARRRDNAEGGVVTIDAPLVLEVDAAEKIAERLLAVWRAETETLQIDLGPSHLAVEPGDLVRLGGGSDAFEVVRIEDAEIRRLELRRIRSPASRSVALAEPGAPPAVAVAPTPAFSILNLPPLPGGEDDNRPLAAVFASPWLGAHDIYVGAPASRRTTAASPAIIGELLWALWPGPVDRWDEGNRIRTKFYGGPLSSVTRDALLNGANTFAIEAAGEWELVQARVCALVGDGEYELSGFLRGRLGSAQAMRNPHPVGARLVLLDGKLVRVQFGAHEWGEALTFAAPPAGGSAADPRAAVQTLILPHAHARPWAPAHFRAQQGASGDIALSWVRCARVGGDTWGASEPPIGAPNEEYRLDVLSGESVVRTVVTPTPNYLYTAAVRTGDFPVQPTSLRFHVAQIGEGGATGLNSELTITL